jgi:5-methylcytosine-specific restriction endonuclease McrA
LGTETERLVRHSSFPVLTYAKRFVKPNPYTTQDTLEREELVLDSRAWLGQEDRPGMGDLRLLAIRRDGFRCRLCGATVTCDTAQVDHIRPVSCYKLPVDANRLENLWTLCVRCHQEKTEYDRQRESRMR